MQINTFVAAIWFTLALMLQAADPASPIIWAAAGAVIFGLALALISMLTLFLSKQGMVLIRNVSHDQIEQLSQRISNLEGENRKLLLEVLELRRVNDKLLLELELALTHIQEIDNGKKKDISTE